MTRLPVLAFLTLLALAPPALAQPAAPADERPQAAEEGLPLDLAAAPPRTGQRLLSGAQEWDGSRTWLVTDDGARYHLPYNLWPWQEGPSQARRHLAHGWLSDVRVTVRARVSRQEGVLTAEVNELVNPARRELRATIEEDAEGLLLAADGERLRVRERFSGPRLVGPLVGRTVDLRAYVFDDGTAFVLAVKARTRGWHFNPIVPASPIMIPWWKKPGTEYWIAFRSSDGEVSVGVRHLDADRLDFDAPGTAGQEPAPERAGITDRLGG